MPPDTRHVGRAGRQRRLDAGGERLLPADPRLVRAIRGAAAVPGTRDRHAAAPFHGYDVFPARPRHRLQRARRDPPVVAVRQANRVSAGRGRGVGPHAARPGAAVLGGRRRVQLRVGDRWPGAWSDSRAAGHRDVARGHLATGGLPRPVRGARLQTARRAPPRTGVGHRSRFRRVVSSGVQHDSLFDDSASQHAAEHAPLAVRMRPRTLDEVLGQRHLLGPGTPLRRLVEGDAPMSLILFGPPGTGKTTLALIVSSATNRRFEQLSALNAGVKDVREVIARAKAELGRTGRQTVLFIDEIHRFSKTQQDSLLAAVEARHVTLVAATTENPFFSIVSPLLSRSLLLTLQPLDDAAVSVLVDRALTDERGLAGAVTLDADARTHLLRLAAGDARRALTALEASAGSVLAAGRTAIDIAALEQAVDTAAVRYD